MEQLEDLIIVLGVRSFGLGLFLDFGLCSISNVKQQVTWDSTKQTSISLFFIDAKMYFLFMLREL